jgi:hypothetical protein
MRKHGLLVCLSDILQPPRLSADELACMSECDGKRNVSVGENVKQEDGADYYRCPCVRFEVCTEQSGVSGIWSDDCPVRTWE